jgi:cytochrome c oxidase subunit 3
LSDSHAIPSAEPRAYTAPELHKYPDADEHAHGHNPYVAHQFDDLAQQKEASTLGMWAFLGTEVMFFAGAFLGYAIYRSYYHEGFVAASRLENWFVGALNTCVLLVSSLTVALAVHAAQLGHRKQILQYLGATIVLGLIFLGVKVFEYSHLIHEGLFPGAWHPDPHTLAAQYHGAGRIFFSFYFAMTGLHALHMIIGVGIIGYIMWMAHKGRFTREYYNPVEITGLYWHFVDIVWIFLYPLLYLVDRS